jgi:hypothetical protein
MIKFLIIILLSIIIKNEKEKGEELIKNWNFEKGLKYWEDIEKTQDLKRKQPKYIKIRPPQHFYPMNNQTKPLFYDFGDASTWHYGLFQKIEIKEEIESFLKLSFSYKPY